MDSYDTLRFILHILFITLIVLGSLLVLLVIYVTKQYQTPSGLLIGNLALTDLLLGTFLLPFGIPAILTDDWPSGRPLCILNGFTNQCLSSVAILNLAAISLDRYVAIIHAIRYHQIMTLKRVGLIVFIVWSIGVVFAIFPLLGWGRYIYQNGTSLCVTDFKTSKSFTFFIFVVVFGIPLNAIFVIYFRIFRAVSKQSKAIRSTSIGPASDQHRTSIGQANQSRNQLTNENTVELTNQSEAQLPNGNTVHPTNQSRAQLSNGDTVELTNQNGVELTNENAVMLANQRGSQLTNENGSQLTDQGGVELANENTVKLPNQTGDQLTMENGGQLTNESGVQSELDLTNEEAPNHATNQSSFTMDHPPTNQSEIFQTNHKAPDKHTAVSPNQITPFSPPPVLPTNHSKVYATNQKRATPRLSKSKSFRRILKRKSKAALTMLAIIGVFLLAMTPFTVYNLYCLHTGESYAMADFITSKIAYSNAIFNPLIYGVMNKLYRKGFYQVFNLIFRCKKRQITHEGSFSGRNSLTLVK